MNQSKRGDILYKDMMQAARNAEWIRNTKRVRCCLSEMEYLNIVIRKAESRQKQIQEDQS